jgi:hypothetical protein
MYAGRVDHTDGCHEVGGVGTPGLGLPDSGPVLWFVIMTGPNH